MKGLEAVLKSFDTQAQIEYYDTIDSTNIRAKAWAKEGASTGCLVIAKEQTLGKGRLGKSWESPKDDGIWMSLIVRPDIVASKASLLTLITGLSLCETISCVTGLEAKIKWPNDIVVNEKKVCGILTEMQAETGYVKYVIIGIGINVNVEKFPKELPYATSLKLEGHTTYDKKAIIKKFLEIFYIYYNQYKAYGFSDMRKTYIKKCINMHKKVNISNAKQKFVAFVKDIDEEGALIVEDEQGTEHTIFTGEVSVRGLYGYV